MAMCIVSQTEEKMTACGECISVNPLKARATRWDWYAHLPAAVLAGPYNFCPSCVQIATKKRYSKNHHKPQGGGIPATARPGS